MYHFVPRVKKLNGFAIWGGVKYREIRLKNVSKLAMELLSEQPNTIFLL